MLLFSLKNYRPWYRRIWTRDLPGTSWYATNWAILAWICQLSSYEKKLVDKADSIKLTLAKKKLFYKSFWMKTNSKPWLPTRQFLRWRYEASKIRKCLFQRFNVVSEWPCGRIFLFLSTPTFKNIIMIFYKYKYFLQLCCHTATTKVERSLICCHAATQPGPKKSKVLFVATQPPGHYVKTSK